MNAAMRDGGPADAAAAAAASARGWQLRKLGLSLVAPLAAFALAILVAVIVLEVSGQPPGRTIGAMYRYGTQADSLVAIVNRATPYYLAAIAVAIGFQMNLFNIGVEGQYRFAVLIAAFVGAQVRLPAPLHIAFIIVVAMAAGAAVASVSAVLKVKRGINEVITSIMMNYIAINAVSYLFQTYFKAERRNPSDLLLKTDPLPGSARFPTFNWVVDLFGKDKQVNDDFWGFVVIAMLVGLVYFLVVWRSRFGFDLRATGINPFAAKVSGVSSNAMVVKTLLMSGAVAGLVGLPHLLSFYHLYPQDFPSDFGFVGIGIALLGRNHPVGIGAAALLWAFLDRSAQILDLEQIPKEIVRILQGVVVLSVVVAYELARRAAQRAEISAAARATQAHELHLAVGAPS